MAMNDRSDPQLVSALQALQSVREPAWLWDCHNGRISWANNTGLAFWQEHDLAKLKKRHFDRSMPALSVMLSVSDQELPKDGITEQLLFWTDNGPRNISCTLSHLKLPNGTSGLLVVGESPKGNELEEIPQPIKWVEQPDNTEADTTFKNSLSSPEDQETLKEIARLLSDPDDETEEQEEIGTFEIELDEPSENVQAITAQAEKNSPFGQLDLEADMQRVNGHINGTLNGHDCHLTHNSDIKSEFSSEDKNTFLAKVNHEVRTPLNSIIGFAELMKEEKFGELGHQKYKGYVEDILESASHALSLINDLLDISKVEAGNFQLAPQPLDLNSTIEHCVSSLQPQTGQARLVIRQSLARNLPKIFADHRSLRQIILNLLSNAIKFTTAGGQIIISTQKENSEQVRMRVRDTGMGMSETDLQIALEPFGQLDTSINGSNGAGLGLPLTKALVEANDSVFHISSQEGRGTLVEILFPIQQVN